MSETVSMIVAFVAGMVLGIIFFGGLWLTVKKAVIAKIPALWVFSSFILRSSIILVGFYFIGDKNWQSLILCLLGFIAARFMVIYITKIWEAKHLHLKKEDLYGA